jgi:branched-chain amino acid transport system permease protein
MEIFLQNMVQGTTLGATYGLVALGFSMQFRAMRLVSFAHGESFTWGAFVALLLTLSGFQSFAVALVVASVILGFAGVFVERLAIRHLYSTPDINMFVATLGLSLVLRQIALLTFHADARPFAINFGDEAFRVGPILISMTQIGTIGSAIVLMVGLDLFLRYTRIGIAMRAVAQDDRTAALMGINTSRIKTLVFGISTALGATAGILFASLTFAVFDMGLAMGLKGFTAAVLGGLGSLPGAVLGGLLLGIVEQLSSGYLSSLYRDTISLVFLVVVLLLLPQGLTGRGNSNWGKV